MSDKGQPSDDLNPNNAGQTPPVAPPAYTVEESAQEAAARQQQQQRRVPGDADLDARLPPSSYPPDSEARVPGDGATSALDGAPPSAAGRVQLPPLLPAALRGSAGVGGLKGSNSPSNRWKPSPVLLRTIVDFGYSEKSAEKALFYTGNSSADLAVGWLLDHPEAQDDTKALDFEGYSSGSDDDDLDLEPINDEMLAGAAQNFKMVFVVNQELRMGLGKVAAQVGHATLGLYRKILDMGDRGAASLASWDEQGETKVVLKTDDGDEQLADLQKSAHLAGLPTYLVRDAGRTQIAAGSVTVLSVFGPQDAVDAVTGKLKLI